MNYQCVSTSEHPEGSDYEPTKVNYEMARDNLVVKLNQAYKIIHGNAGDTLDEVLWEVLTTLRPWNTLEGKAKEVALSLQGESQPPSR